MLLWSILLGEVAQRIGQAADLIKLEYFPDGSCLGMALQESLEEGYKADYSAADDGIHPDFPSLA